jgi:hypothetical protein
VCVGQSTLHSRLPLAPGYIKGLKTDRWHLWTSKKLLKLTTQVNIQLMRTFVRLRQMLASNETVIERLNELEENYDAKFKIVFRAIRKLMNPAAVKRKPIGFRTGAKA